MACCKIQSAFTLKTTGPKQSDRRGSLFCASTSTSSRNPCSLSIFLSKQSRRDQTCAFRSQRNICASAGQHPFEGADTNDPVPRLSLNLPSPWLHPEMSSEELKKFSNDTWEDQWRGMNTNWWTEIESHLHAEKVYVLLFGVGSGNEGVYSLQRWTEDGLPHDTVLSFADKADADRYAHLLQTEMGRLPTVEPISPDTLQEFCQESMFDLRVVDSRAVVFGLFLPPTQSTELTDWERAARLRTGAFNALGEDGMDMKNSRPVVDLASVSSEDIVTQSSREYLERIFRNMN